MAAGYLIGKYSNTLSTACPIVSYAIFEDENALIPYTGTTVAVDDPLNDASQATLKIDK